MMAAKRYIITLGLVLTAINLPAQNITGTWEGDLGNDQFLQLNIIQNGDKICGYTWDYVKADKRSFCKAYFEGTYDKNKKKLTISGKSFIANSGSHVLMNLNLNYKTVKGEEVLEEKPTLESVLGSIFQSFRMFDDDPFARPSPAEPATDVTAYVRIKKVSGKPAEILDRMKDCMDKALTDTIAKVEPEKPRDSLPTVVTIPVPQKKDSLPPVAVIVPPEKDSLSKPSMVEQRKNIEQSHITINVKTINLKVYDNAIFDGDTVSIFYNGRMLLSHQLLSEKPIEINLELDANQTRHEITLFAENLGSIPPNTALVVITAGDKRYELFASANLQENAVLVFDYRPK